MRNVVFTRVGPVIVCLQLACGASLLAAGETIRGEPLDPATHGPGLVETMAQALAREQLARQTELVGPQAPEAKYGAWVVPSRRATYYPHTGEHNVVNKFGDPQMGLRFPSVVDVRGAYFAGQGAEGTWTSAIRVIGYRDGKEVGKTDWFSDIGEEPRWLAMNLRAVDRIVILSTPVFQGGGWYGMDDLTFTISPQGQQERGELVVLDFEDLSFNTTLTGSGYAGLVWETGPGVSEPQMIPAPQIFPAAELDLADEAPQEQVPALGPLTRAATAPVLTRDFQGVVRGDVGQWSAPPDTCGAVGPDHFLEVVNTVLAVYDKESSMLLVSMSLSTFLPGSSGDTRVLFDQHSNRWVVIVCDFNTRVYLAVSLTDDPTGEWFKTSILVSQGDDAGRWPDYPTLGVDQHGIYTAAYMVGGGMSIFALDKAPLIAAEPSLGTVTAFRNLPWEGAIQPAHTYGTPAGEYLVSRSGSTSLRVRRINPPLTSPTLTEVGFVSVSYHSSPPDAPALGCSTPLDTVDYRPMNAFYRDGSLWTCHCISYGGRAAARWYEINPLTAGLIQSGTVSDGTLYYFFPSIAVNDFGRVVLGISGSHANQYVSTYYTGRLSSDPPGEMATPVMYHAGVAGQDIIDGYGRNRFGDYSLTTLDPVDELSLWTIQEYGHAQDVWGTWVGVLASADCNGNGADDQIDIIEGTSQDCNDNVVPDECEPDEDCNGNLVQDICDIAGDTSQDCNANSAPDECDIIAGTSADADEDEVPDECEAAVLYVDAGATGLGQGTTWTHAYTDLQTALNIAVLPDSAASEIWVAAGTYRPSKPVSLTDPRTATFQLIDEVALYGGFAGGETLRDQRAPKVNQTVFSGDLEQNDHLGDLTDNSYHVLTASAVGPTTVLDGFTITAGQADGMGGADRGAGLLAEEADLSVANCTFLGNHASYLGGGFQNKDGGSPTLSRCIFLGNSSDSRGGGWANSLFSGNSAANGGALANNGTLTLADCSFGGNSAVTFGGGIYNFKTTSSLTVTNSILWGNSDNGGTDQSAQVHVANGTTTVTYCCFQGWPTPGVDGNLDVDPQFLDADGGDDLAGTADDNLRLQAGSPCIDVGDNSAVPPGYTRDLDGKLRIRDGNGDEIAVVDLGAYEFAPPSETCVCGDIDGSGGDVDLTDFSSFALCYGLGTPGGDCPAQTFVCSDLDGSGEIDLTDFGTFAILFGATSSNEVPNCLD